MSARRARSFPPRRAATGRSCELASTAEERVCSSTALLLRGLLHFGVRDIPHMLRERPLMTFRIFRRIPPVAIEGVCGFFKNLCSVLCCPREVLVHFVYSDVHHLRDSAELFGVFELRSGATHHEDTAVGMLHCRMLNRSVCTLEAGSILGKPERLLQEVQGFSDVPIQKVGSDL